jgi:hypothetical protein
MNKDKFSDGKDYESVLEWSDIGYPHDVKQLILRPLSSMTEEEQDHVWQAEEPNSILQMENGTKVRKVVLAPERTAYLLSKGFDLFNLIPEGLAVNAETLK